MVTSVWVFIISSVKMEYFAKTNWSKKHFLHLNSRLFWEKIQILKTANKKNKIKVYFIKRNGKKCEQNTCDVFFFD